MSSRATGTSSLTQRYCCFRREPQPLCSRLNEIERMRSGKLVPLQRHRYRRTQGAPRRIGDVQRLPANVHVVVHEDLAGPLRNAPLEGDVLGMQAHEMPADQLAHLPRGLEIDG